MSTKRPIFFSLQNNPEANKPKITLRRDLSIAGAERDVELEDFAQVEAELEKRQQKLSNIPIYVQIDLQNVINTTFIDTPGLETAEAEQTVAELIRPIHRFILCVEQANDWSALKMLNVVKKQDPSLSRTTMVYTRFYHLLKTLNQTQKLNRFLASKPHSTQSFYVSLFTSQTRQGVSGQVDKFRDRVYQAFVRDRDFMDSLQYDKRFAKDVGLQNLNKFIQEMCWKRFQEAIPQILKQLRQTKRDSLSKLQRVQQMMQQLNSVKLRTIATNYVVQFLQIVEKLIAGTSEGNPLINGQTLDEEKLYAGEWVDSNSSAIEVPYEEYKIPYFNSRLYGGVQFERALAEFKAVVEHLSIPELSLDDVATSSGINRLNNLPNYTYAACDIATQKVREALATLIEQLGKRAVYIMKRLVSVAQKVFENRKKSRSIALDGVVMSQEEEEDFDSFPFFTYHVKDLYNEFVDQTAERVREKCMDEFYCTQTVYFEFNEMASLSKDFQNMDALDVTDGNALRDAVSKLAKKVFDDLKKRICKNVMLKFYNFFIVPLETNLWNELQGTITILSDSALNEIFQTSTVKEKLAEDEKQLQQQSQRLTAQEQEFLKVSTTFSHPLQSKTSTEEQSTNSLSSFGSSNPPTSLYK